MGVTGMIKLIMIFVYVLRLLFAFYQYYLPNHPEKKKKGGGGSVMISRCQIPKRQALQIISVCSII